MLGAPHIRGCYESRMPAYLSALEHLSCTARVADRSLVAPPATWTLSNLFRHPSHAPSYLSGDVAAGAAAPAGAGAAAAAARAARAPRQHTDGALGLLKYVIVVMVDAERGGKGVRSGGGRGVWAVVLPAAKKLIIIMLQRDNMAPRELVSVTAEEMWAEVSAEADKTATGPTLKNAADYTVEVHVTYLLSFLYFSLHFAHYGTRIPSGCFYCECCLKNTHAHILRKYYRWLT